MIRTMIMGNTPASSPWTSWSVKQPKKHGEDAVHQADSTPPL